MSGCIGTGSIWFSDCRSSHLFMLIQGKHNLGKREKKMLHGIIMNKYTVDTNAIIALLQNIALDVAMHGR